MKLPGLALSLAVAGFALIIPEAAEAARINELSDSTLMDRAARFFTFKDPSLRNALAGSMLLGVCCGLMGAFLVVRKLSCWATPSRMPCCRVALGFFGTCPDPIAILSGRLWPVCSEREPSNSCARPPSTRRMPLWALCLPRSA